VMKTRVRKRAGAREDGAKSDSQNGTRLLKKRRWRRIDEPIEGELRHDYRVSRCRNGSGKRNSCVWPYMGSCQRRLCGRSRRLAAWMICCGRLATLSSHTFATRLFLRREGLTRNQAAKSRRSRPHKQKNNTKSGSRLRHQIHPNKKKHAAYSNASANS